MQSELGEGYRGIPCQSSATAFQSTIRSSCPVQTFQKSGSFECGVCPSGSCLISTRTGIGVAHPSKIAFLVGRIGNSLSNPTTLSGTSFRTNCWSWSLTSLCNKNVLHCERTVGDSEGFPKNSYALNY